MKKTFNNPETFKAYYAAQKYAEKQGYSVGQMCGKNPIALKKGNWNIAKWKNLAPLEKLDIDGHITSVDFRKGPVDVEMFEGAK